jgi:hypothetical protein
VGWGGVGGVAELRGGAGWRRGGTAKGGEGGAHARAKREARARAAGPRQPPKRGAGAQAAPAAPAAGCRTFSPALMRPRTSSDISSGSSGSKGGRFKAGSRARDSVEFSRSGPPAYAVLARRGCGARPGARARGREAGRHMSGLGLPAAPRAASAAGASGRQQPRVSAKRAHQPRCAPELKGSLSTTLISGSRSASARMVVDLPVPRSPMIMTPPIWGGRRAGGHAPRASQAAAADEGASRHAPHPGRRGARSGSSPAGGGVPAPVTFRTPGTLSLGPCLCHAV